MGERVIALIAGTTAAASLRRNVLPAYAGWVAAAVAVVALAAFGMQLGSDLGFFGLGAYAAIMVFALITSIAMIRSLDAPG